jgi:phosphoribosylamine--glycine ligase
VPFADDEFMSKVRSRIVEPTLAGLKRESLEYKGFIFLGLMNVDGDPMVIEYNVRMGDPETQTVMARLKSDLVDLLEGVAENTLAMKPMTISNEAAAAVVLVSGGYPGSYQKGKVIEGLDSVAPAIVFHAGTKAQDGRVLTSGGRVLAVVDFGEDIAQAARNAQAAASKITFEGAYHRSDIGQDLI